MGGKGGTAAGGCEGEKGKMGGREEGERDGGEGGEEIRERQYFQSELLFSILNSPPAGCRYVSRS